MGDGLPELNSFINGRIGLKYMPNKPKNLDVLSSMYISFGNPSLELFHLQKNDFSSIGKNHYHFFSLFVLMFKYRCNLATTQF
jgi:hypothetical protein